ncbi:MAG TPA: hypothetical protein VFW91_16200 [Candidatus Binatia bacterium]|jgi:hypothetical protein|nr:hypothetical protein [Candidatus Binatia bacterium]
MRPFPVIDADGHVIARDRELPEFLPDPTGGGIIHAGCMDYPRKNFRPWSVPAKTDA